jgi:hypothetical protein
MLAHVLGSILLLTGATAAPKRPATGATQVRAKGVVAAKPIAPELQSALSHLGEPVRLTKAERRQLDKMIFALPEVGDEVLVAMPAGWETFAKKWSARTHAKDLTALTQYVLRKAYLDDNASLREEAAKLQYYNELKRELRKQILDLRGRLEGLGPTDELSIQPLTIHPTYSPGTRPVVVSNTKVIVMVPAAEADLATWEEAYSSAGELSELAMLDLQNVLQKQQQAMQMMSNISKMLHDTAKSIISNMK